jgi:hypothetical protein
MEYLDSLSVFRIWQEGLRVPAPGAEGVVGGADETQRRVWLNFRTGRAGGINNEDTRPNRTGRTADLQIINGHPGNRMLYRITAGPVAAPWSAEATILVPEAIINTRNGRVLGRNLPPNAVLEYRHITSGAGAMYGVLLDWQPPEQIVPPAPPVPPTILPGVVRVVVGYGVGRVTAGAFSAQAAAFGGPVALGFALLELRGSRLYGAPFRVADGARDLASGRWVTSGLPWWGGAEPAARQGRWVRRAGWFSRRLRYTAGDGTTRAVAVDQDGAPITTDGFGPEEFFAQDWEMADGGEPQLVDITDAFFSLGTLPEVVVRTATDPAPDSTSQPSEPSLQSISVPAAGEGFVYFRSGRTTLVPARRAGTLEVWRPS